MKDLPRILVLSEVADRTERCLFKALTSSFKIDMIVDPREPFKDEFRDSGINVIEIHIKNRFDLFSAWKIRKIIKENKHEIVYSTFNKGLSVSLFATVGMKCQVVVYRGTMGNISRLDPSCWFAHLHPRLRMIVCNSAAVKKFLLDFGFSEKKLYTIYKGHCLDWYIGEKKKSRSDFSIPEDSFVVGCVANVRELKGIDYIVKAMAELKDLNIHLIVVGKNDDPKYEELAKELGVDNNVHFLGFREDAVEIARIFDLGLMASTRREGLPRSIVELMAQGIPAVVTNIGGMPELVVHNKTGFVVPAKDSTAIARAVRELYNNREQLKLFGENSRRWIAKRFSSENALQEYNKLFISLKEEYDRKK